MRVTPCRVPWRAHATLDASLGSPMWAGQLRCEPARRRFPRPVLAGSQLAPSARATVRRRRGLASALPPTSGNAAGTAAAGHGSAERGTPRPRRPRRRGISSSARRAPTAFTVRKPWRRCSRPRPSDPVRDAGTALAVAVKLATRRFNPIAYVSKSPRRRLRATQLPPPRVAHQRSLCARPEPRVNTRLMEAVAGRVPRRRPVAVGSVDTAAGGVARRTIGIAAKPDPVLVCLPPPAPR